MCRSSLYRSFSSVLKSLTAVRPPCMQTACTTFRSRTGFGHANSATVVQHRLCSSQIGAGPAEAKTHHKSVSPIEIIPLPEGIDGSRIGLYELVGTEGTGPKGDGYRAVFGVHGPREHWPAKGGNIEAAGGGMFACVEVAGKQYKVTAGDTLYAHRIDGEVNSQLVFDKVGIVGTMLWTVFGRPLIPGATVSCTVEAQTLTAKVIVTKFKKRKGYTRRKGHRQPITRLHIDSVDYSLPPVDQIVPHEVVYNPLRPPLPNRPRFV
jgi:large subunit ribosomal protein L21